MPLLKEVPVPISVGTDMWLLLLEEVQTVHGVQPFTTHWRVIVNEIVHGPTSLQPYLLCCQVHQFIKQF
jgi:hypothetical protein